MKANVFKVILIASVFFSMTTAPFLKNNLIENESNFFDNRAIIFSTVLDFLIGFFSVNVKMLVLQVSDTEGVWERFPKTSFLELYNPHLFG